MAHLLREECDEPSPVLFQDEDSEPEVEINDDGLNNGLNLLRTEEDEVEADNPQPQPQLFGDEPDESDVDSQPGTDSSAYEGDYDEVDEGHRSLVDLSFKTMSNRIVSDASETPSEPSKKKRCYNNSKRAAAAAEAKKLKEQKAQQKEERLEPLLRGRCRCRDGECFAQFKLQECKAFLDQFEKCNKREQDTILFLACFDEQDDQKALGALPDGRKEYKFVRIGRAKGPKQKVKSVEDENSDAWEGEMPFREVKGKLQQSWRDLANIFQDLLGGTPQSTRADILQELVTKYNSFKATAALRRWQITPDQANAMVGVIIGYNENLLRQKRHQLNECSKGAIGVWQHILTATWV
ncbi:unnamed protein product [Durusdinium trenchii]|uniref:Uncharacterized protein n=1 Tax=Durusdinium trenchii TaxID=1381693 RepID=A0ABP0KG05_9DINO